MSEQIYQLVEKIAKWIAAHAEMESSLLYPNPQHTVNAISFLDYLHELTGISKDTISDWADKENYKAEGE